MYFTNFTVLKTFVTGPYSPNKVNNSYKQIKFKITFIQFQLFIRINIKNNMQRSAPRY